MHDLLIQSIKKNSYDVSAWFESHVKKIPVPLMMTITINDAGMKATPMGTQLFPMGIDNLCKTDQQNIPKLLKKYFKKYYADIPNFKKILLLTAVNHPNPYYYEHIRLLTQLFKKSGLKVQLGSLEGIQQPVTVQTPSKKTLKIVPCTLQKKKLIADGVEPEFIYITYPFPHELTRKLAEVQQPMNPPLKILSLQNRVKSKKSDYYTILNRLASDFAELIKVDPWLMKAEFQVEHHVNFDERSGIEKVADSADTLLNVLQMKYREYDVEKEPAVRIMNNAGTYGMGILSVHSTEELSKVYHRKKAKRAGGKGQSIVNDVIIQEEIPTSPLFQKYTGETVIYLIGNEVAGGYIKTYGSDSKKKTLSRSELFLPICLTSTTHTHPKKRADRKVNVLYSNLSRMGGIACGYEIDKMPS